MSDDAAPPARANRPSNGGLSIKELTIGRKTLIGIIVALGGTSGGGLYLGARADDTAGEAKERAVEAKAIGTAGARAAQTAKVEASAGYAATREKLDATAEVAADAASACVTRAELEAVHRRIDALPLAGRRGRGRGRRPVVVVPPEVKAPLPVTPAAAAAQGAAP